MKIGDRLRAERERLGHSQDQWASVTGIHRNTQVKYEKGEGSPNAEYLAEIECIGADINYIITGEKTVLADTSLDRECSIISVIIEKLETVLNNSNKALSPQKKARAIAILFRLAHPTGEVTEEMVKEIINLAQ